MPVEVLNSTVQAARYNAPIEQGRDWPLTLTIKDENSVAIDITGYTFFGEVRREAAAASASLGDFTYEITDADAGQVRFLLPRAVTSTFGGITSVVWDLFMIDTNDEQRPILAGKSKVIPRVSDGE